MRISSRDLHPFGDLNLWRLLTQRAALSPDDPFIVWQPFDAASGTWTYRDLVEQASAVAVGLARRGVKPGDRMLIHLENCPEFIVSWFACAALGAIAVTTNTRSAPDELAYYAQDSGVVGAITQPKFASVVAANAPNVRFLSCTDHDGGVPAQSDLGEPFAALSGDPDDLRIEPVDPLAPASVQYTSGTTSRPKGVLWTQANALWGARLNAAHQTLRADDSYLVYLPLFHTNALAYSMLGTMWAGGRLVLIPKWSSSRFWDISMRHGCTFTSLVGLSTRFLAQVDAPEGHRYRHFGLAASYPELEERCGVKTIGWWGMTETISHPIVGDPFLPNRPLAIGRPSPEYQVRIVHDDGDTPVDAEETGYLQVKGIPGLSLFSEYLHQPKATEDSYTEDGWFRTGDLVIQHADGHVTFGNRAKDMLKVGAENVSAAEVERVIMSVSGVVEAAVVGRPDDKLDEVPVAFVLTSDPAGTEELVEKIRAACTDTLADFKVPRAVYRVDELPRSTLNKVDKKALREVAEPDSDRAAAAERWLTSASSDPSGDAS
ncbi:MAG TPA: AMP-binding protein [Pseudonocardia sp.]|nr:AMP-binding protein [Pseudonocardia sp.]